MPLTKSGKEVLASMKKEYGAKKGKSVFYASIKAGKKGSEKWHKGKKSHSKKSKKGSSMRSRIREKIKEY